MSLIQSAPTTGRAARGWWGLVRRLGIDMHRGEGAVAGMLFLYFFLIVTFQYVSKTVRQSTFIDGLGAEKLPIVYLLLAVCTVPLLLVYSRFVDRVHRHHLIAVTSALIAASVVGFWWLYQFEGTWIRLVFYIWMSIVYVLNVSQFWSYANHVFDPRQAKRLFAFIGAGGLLGGVAGGRIASIVSDLAGTRFVLLVAAAILFATTGLIYLVHRVAHSDDSQTGGAAGLGQLEEAQGGFDVFKQSRHLRLIGGIMLLTIIVANVVDIQFNWAMDAATANIDPSQRLDALTGGYGDFYAIMGLSALIFQIVFTARIHRLLGIGVALRVLPVTMALGTAGLFVAASMVPGVMLTACRLLKIGESGLRYSLDQASRELLFLPVPSNARLKAKAYIDVFVQRSGKAAAGLLLLPVTFGLMSAVQAGWISLALIVVWLVVIAAARREYVRSFRQGLRQRTVEETGSLTLSDLTTLEILVQSLGSADPRQVLHSLELLASHGRGNLVPPVLLYHDDSRVRLKTLQVLIRSDRRDAVPLIERRLGDEDALVRSEAVRALAVLMRQDACAMMQPRLGDADPAVRAAAVTCLVKHGDETAVRKANETLDDMVSDADPAARAEAATAIGGVEEPWFQGRLVRLLYDSRPEVARVAIDAVRGRVERDGYNPLYAPILISFLQNRRLKHDSREALLAFGETVLPALIHFMNDPQESIWVRRGLPKTIAQIGTPAAILALVEALGAHRDAFLRRKIIEALTALRSERDLSHHAPNIEEAVRFECGRYLVAFCRLSALEIDGRGRFDGPLVRWDSADEEPELLERLLAERLDDHLRNIFGLLSLIRRPRDIRAAYLTLTGRRDAPRSHALELLDNELSGDLRKIVLVSIGDSPHEEKLRLARRLFGADARSKTDTLRRMLDPPADDGDAASLAAAALYAVYTERVSELYPRVEALASEGGDPFVTETAAWVLDRLDRAVP